MMRAGSLLMFAFVAAAICGCVERRFVITTDPPGAVVYNEKDIPISASPADQQFVYYGTYRFKLMKDGYQTKIVYVPIKAPVYGWAFVDFFTENLIPYTFRDVRHLHFPLDPLEPVSPEKVLSDGNVLRERGMGVGAPLPPSVALPRQDGTMPGQPFPPPPALAPAASPQPAGQPAPPPPPTPGPLQ